ncbi:Uncharacterised protein [BD1-7 clade bacterium]|uniref:Ysc84 actin-binding domain-containing protein n=1 Tax=BD1-7 clade bacterium TaxID=2029982 RepID=A0A5S9NS61_9GAMM|nr:Uncharacterised protein [BD1-7 clade bacterium]CAA0093404.1 Uncharacterised protein [BD1-7 clade bacterium]CAA0122076.1 Uncharacterised protein [BD1-7 clade bacterium]
MTTLLYRRKSAVFRWFTAILLSVMLVPAFAEQTEVEKYADTVRLFKDAGVTKKFFDNAYGYAVFPSVGKGGFIIGGAYGDGRVFRQGSYVGNTTVSQVSVGFQIGGQAYSQLVFLQDKRAFDEFTSGTFEFGAQANAVAITAGANAEATTGGSSVSASGGKNDATVAARYHKGMSVFTIAKGGLMFQASIGGQNFTYDPLKK